MFTWPCSALFATVAGALLRAGDGADDGTVDDARTKAVENCKRVAPRKETCSVVSVDNDAAL